MSPARPTRLLSSVPSNHSLPPPPPQHDADTAFEVVESSAEMIRAVVIACAALVASAAGPGNPKIVRQR